MRWKAALALTTRQNGKASFHHVDGKALGEQTKERFSADLGDLLITHTVFIDAQYSSKAYQTQTGY